MMNRNNQDPVNETTFLIEIYLNGTCIFTPKQIDWENI